MRPKLIMIRCKNFVNQFSLNLEIFSPMFDIPDSALVTSFYKVLGNEVVYKRFIQLNRAMPKESTETFFFKKNRKIPPAGIGTLKT